MSNKNLKYYLALNYLMAIRWDTDDKVFFVMFPDLPYCMAHGKTPTSAVNCAQKIKKEWLKGALFSGIEIAEPTDNQYYHHQEIIIKPAKRLLDALLKKERKVKPSVVQAKGNRQKQVLAQTM